MSMHDEILSEQKPSLLAVSCIYVGLKICEQLKKREYMNSKIVQRLVQLTKTPEKDILEVS